MSLAAVLLPLGVQFITALGIAFLFGREAPVRYALYAALATVITYFVTMYILAPILAGG